ncbi:MAG: hypothetical protein KU37_08935 [Sulfuricurvum sp. PC08-66]|nr:MAG: hypothetical protein KU37_08935 [Sulfuricurvum sp. PC08-66]
MKRLVSVITLFFFYGCSIQPAWTTALLPPHEAVSITPAGPHQATVALLKAKAQLSHNVQTHIYSQLLRSQTCQESDCQNDLQTRSLQTTQALMQHVRILDEWRDTNGTLYLHIEIPSF